MFDKILIANRGEIACRVIKTARRLGIATVAVFSEADVNARHVRLADEAVAIGPAPARDSYLRIDRILDAANRTGAQAIHPGYGFLSENADFAEACAANDVVFIGPPASAIRAMGSKSAAKSLMEKAGVPLTPGYHGDDQDASFLARQADAIGYPILIKASAGGGGKGMRVVERESDFDTALASCQREAAAAFADDRVLLEKYLARSRHIEIQIFADSRGNTVHLFERDCSVQRRHQKVLEEAPAPGLSAERRAAMGQAAVNAARAVGYVGAGTVEFIFDRDSKFYFMEMNTRLQVEHPVTEMIAGVDLVEWQLRVAAGEPLPLKQEQLTIDGHAIEARIYAEDPAKDFLPSTGRLLHLSPPAESSNVRIDSGVDQGDEITPHYDPMIAKLIVWDSDRARAIVQMQKALAQYRIAGPANNIAFLSRLAACPAFVDGDFDTSLIERERGPLFSQDLPVPDDVWLCAALAELLLEHQQASLVSSQTIDPNSPWHARDGWRLNGHAHRQIEFRHDDVEVEVDVAYSAHGFELTLNDRVTTTSGTLSANGELDGRLSDHRVNATVVVSGERRHVFHGGRAFLLIATDPSHLAGDNGGQHGLLAPMPGTVIALLAETGDAIEKGAPLLVLEAMKMEHTIRAPNAGRVKSFRFAVGDRVMEGAELVEFEIAPSIFPPP